MLRPLVQRLLFAAMSLSFATPAFAGFTLPYSSDVCAGIFSPLDALDDPNVFGVYVRCEDLCKVTEKDCEKYVKDAFSCEIQLTNDNRDYANKQCDNNPPEMRKACKQAAASIAQGQRDGAKLDREEAISLCKVWGASCLTNCGGLL